MSCEDLFAACLNSGLRGIVRKACRIQHQESWEMVPTPLRCIAFAV
jgi:hypothetical protein